MAPDEKELPAPVYGDSVKRRIDVINLIDPLNLLFCFPQLPLSIAGLDLWIAVIRGKINNWFGTGSLKS